MMFKFWLCAGLFAFASATQAALITFDTLAPTANQHTGGTAQSTIRPGAYTELTLFPSGGQPVTISRQNGARFDLVDNTLPRQLGKDPEWGPSPEDIGLPGIYSTSLDPFFDTTGSAMVFTFQNPISSFSILVGDFGGDGDAIVLHAYTGLNLQGTKVTPAAGAQFSLPNMGTNKAWTDTRITFTAPNGSPGFRSVSVIGGVGGTHTVFYDRLVYVDIEGPGPGTGLDDVHNPGDYTSTTVPEPGIFTLAAAGLMGLLLRRSTPRSRS